MMDCSALGLLDFTFILPFITLDFLFNALKVLQMSVIYLDKKKKKKTGGKKDREKDIFPPDFTMTLYHRVWILLITA